MLLAFRTEEHTKLKNSPTQGLVFFKNFYCLFAVDYLKLELKQLKTLLPFLNPKEDFENYDDFAVLTYDFWIVEKDFIGLL